MKLRLTCFAVMIAFAAHSQSKKELTDEVTKLKAELAQLKKPKEVDLSKPEKKASYGIGVLIGSNMRAQGGDSLDLDAINAGMSDVYLGKELKMQREEAGAFVQEYMQRMMDRKRGKFKEENVAFLAANKSKPGVVTTASGLQYKILRSGSGKSPGPTDSVRVHYAGKTIDGVEFESSVKEGKPAVFRVTQVITGWTEAIQLMHEGDKWMLWIPSNLAYGERGSGGVIPPNATLIFELELLAIIPAK